MDANGNEILNQPASQLEQTRTRVQRLCEAIQSIAPNVFMTVLTVDALNERKWFPTMESAPNSEESSEDAFFMDMCTISKVSPFQLASNSIVVVNELELSDGKLNEIGTANLARLQLLHDGFLCVECQSGEVRLPLDVKMVVLSGNQSGSLLKTNIIVPYCSNVTKKYATLPIYPPTPPPSTPINVISDSRVECVRMYVDAFASSTSLPCTLNIPESVSDLISSWFSSERQLAHKNGGRILSSDDLSLNITLAKLMSLSMGEAAMTESSWKSILALEHERMLLLSPPM